MTNFKEIRFPTNIAYGMVGGPEYSTDIITMASGKEQRNINWSCSRARYHISHAVKTREQIEQLSSFFRECRGRAYGFRFKDQLDYIANDEFIGFCDGEQKIFQLVKNYGTEIRKICKPVQGTVKVYVNRVLVEAEINYGSGEIVFAEAPEAGSRITASFEFDVPVRFDNDHFLASSDGHNTYSWNDISLIEVK